MEGAAYNRYVAKVKNILQPGEHVDLIIAEHRRASPKPLSPAVLYATDKRMIIMRINLLGTSRSYKIIHYKDILEIMVEHRMWFSKVHFSLRVEDSGGEEYKKWVSGLTHDEMGRLLHFVESKRIGIKEMDVKEPINAPT